MNSLTEANAIKVQTDSFDEYEVRNQKEIDTESREEYESNIYEQLLKE